MNKFFLFFLFSIFLFAQYLKFPYSIDLKKDEIAKFIVYYDKWEFPFEFRWTLFKNDILTFLYKYNNFPRQVELYKDPPLNILKVKIAPYPVIYPYFLIEFVDYNDKIATFKIYLFNGEKVRVKEIK